MPIEVFAIEHIDLTVNDVARSRAYYDKVLAELGFRKGGGRILSLCGKSSRAAAESVLAVGVSPRESGKSRRAGLAATRFSPRL